MKAGRVVFRGGLGLALLFWASLALAELREVVQCGDIPNEIVFLGPKAAGASPWRFERYGAEKRWLSANPEDYPGHGMAHVRNCSERPFGRQIQVMSFRFRSEGYLLPGVVNHIAIGLRSKLSGYVHGAHSGIERVQGRGVVIGSVASGWPEEDLCPGPFPLVQPETWGRLPGVTRLWGRATAGDNHCGPSLRDGVWYRFSLRADDTSLEYAVHDDKGRLLRRHRFTDRLMGETDRQELRGNSGYFLAVMCADADASCRRVPAWRLQVRDFKVSWQ